MDEPDVGGEPVVTATGGVTLQKRLETGEFRQPTVLYEFESQRDTPVDVRVIEPIPSALEPPDLGFLGAGDDRTWEINGPKLVFESSLEPGGSRRTGVAARGDRADAIGDLLAAPEFVDVDEAEAGRRLDADGGSATADHPESVDGAGPLVERLVAELRDGTVSAESVAALKAELGTGPRERPSLEARLAQLQADVADVRAYTNAMERFLDEHGSPADAVERLEGRLDGLDERVETVEAEVAARDGQIDAVEKRLAAVEGEIEALETSVERVDDRLPETDVEDRLAAVESELSSVTEFTTSLKAAFRE